MEPIMHAISRDLALDKQRIRKTNCLLRKKLDIVKKLLEKDPLFKKMYKDTFYGGSYYDHLKIRQPDEFDIDLLLEFEEESLPYLVPSTDKPGYVYVKIGKPNTLSIEEKALLTSDGYLSSSKVRSWMQSIVARYIQEYDKKQSNCKYKLCVKKGCVKTSGPAVTLRMADSDGFAIDIDLVPCFLFTTWPGGAFRRNPTQDERFFIAPKSVDQKYPHADRYWRLSFQEQERKIIHDKQSLKPTCRFIKALRDSYHQDKIASYFIKTIFLFEVERNNPNFWHKSLNEMFLIMLNRYIEYLDQRDIPNFWNEDHNLLLNIKMDTLQQYADEMRRFKNIFLNEPGRIRTEFRIRN